ncbi:phytanoyl-CoA dioxygenase family protein [Spirosoma sp. HMF4905]|uniref:Phytanoyl-CoA dioxygenase family protein n=1 Tax=Spirosoma arboris TaxID=2682092 RepID=A0A7K1SCJ7_9BACT|nr:phytanoyl-CoA dioxygenase family protein [Spirosoma arboris]MVM31388.1 phytanoyl-CoA dioxygenase family protein [Spirosoma arboris]
MSIYQLSDEQIAQYHRDGYLIVSKLFSSEEIDRLYQVAIDDTAISQHSYDLNDQSGKKTKLALWFTPGNDMYGLLTRSERIVQSVNKLLDSSSPVCHFHSKLMQKEPLVGGAWEWHQDYGYWYKNEFLFPDQMFSVMVAITEATKENGCLQVIKGSHKMGRVEHGFAGEQVGASQRYVDLALKTMELIYVELKPGDALFFHSNLLHRSEANLSENARWSLISCYNRQDNVPYNESSTSCITPLETVPDEALLTWQVAGITDQTDFLNKENDVSLT